jgi:hypothetical protein
VAEKKSHTEIQGQCGYCSKPCDKLREVYLRGNERVHKICPCCRKYLRGYFRYASNDLTRDLVCDKFSLTITK